ncbi:MAG: GHKL domain-containing protein [Coprobacillus sp.]
MKPLYHQAVEHFNHFVYVSVLIYFNFAYYFIKSDEITKTLFDEKITLLLLIILSCSFYVSVFHSLKNLDNEYRVKEENIRFKNRQDVMRVSLERLEERFNLQEKVTSQIRIAQHDHRHFSRMLLELLHNGEIEKAIDSLEKQLHVTIKTKKKYCENTVVNAAISFYIERCEENDIQVVTKLDIPYEIQIDSLKLSLILSNLLENAIHACMKLQEAEKKYILFTVAYTHKQLIVEMKNPYDGKISLDKDGYPTSSHDEHGFGTKSIIEFVNTYNGEVLYQTDNKIFVVRILI